MDYRDNKLSSRRNRLSDHDMLFDLLLAGKYMSQLYDHAIMEATDETVRDAFIELQQDEHRSAQSIFEFMQQQGWYTTGANRQNLGRRLGQAQQLSGGMAPRADSRYAVTSGARRLGSRLDAQQGSGGQLSEQPGRGQGNVRPPKGSKPGLFNARSDWNV